MFQTGDVLLEKYRLLEKLGQGGMGYVYVALNEQIEKKVAIKFLLSAAAADEHAMARFRLEAKAAAAIDHPAVIDIYDMGVAEDGSPFLVMELLQGENLKDLLDQRGRLDQGLTAYVACHVLSALEVAHEKRIIHRDLKPENIFLVQHGQDIQGVKLLDFGISKIIDDSRDSCHITATGAVLGTPYYMSPEQACGNRDIDRRADLYAMGVILYECLTGRVPSVGANYNEVIVNILTRPVVTPRELVASIPAELERIVLKALSKAVEDRYASAAELIDDLLLFVPPNQASTILHRSMRSELVHDPKGSARTGSTRVSAARAGRGALDEGTDADISESVTVSATFAPKPPKVAEEGAARPGSGRSRVGLAALIAVGVVAVSWSTASLWGGHGEQDERARPSSASQRDEPEPARDERPPTLAETAAGSEKRPTLEASRSVELSFDATPRAATLYFDDAELPSNPFIGRFPQDGIAHRLKATAAGHETWSQIVVLDQDRGISASLTGRPSATAKQPGSTSADRPTATPPVKADGLPAREDGDPWRD